MSEPIKLTTAERSAAITASLKATADGWRDHVLLNAILDAINKVRGGDPVGTIRLGRAGSLAVRVRVLDEYGNYRPDAWVHVSTATGTMSRPDTDTPDAYADWKVIYTPEAS